MCCCWSLLLASSTGFSNWVLLFMWLKPERRLRPAAAAARGAEPNDAVDTIAACFTSGIR